MLTKSKYMAGLKCLRYLWFCDRKKLPESSLLDKVLFEGGFEFETYARQFFPKAKDLSSLDFSDNITKTNELIKLKISIIEAGLSYENYYVRSDVLEHVKDNIWNLYEIKSTTSEKKYHYPDLAYQKFVCEKLGMTINGCFLLHLNKDFNKNGDIDFKELVVKVDVTNKVNEVTGIDEDSKRFLDVINSKDIPDIVISRNCKSPHVCPLKDECWSMLPKKNIFLLKDWRLYWKMCNQGLFDLKDIDEEIKLKPIDANIKDATLKNKVYMSKEHIKHFLNTIKYPIYHFDFETFSTAVPKFDESSPYQNIPFQYSLHVEQKTGKIKHFEYLATGDEDPRIKLLEQLKDEIGTKGSILTYNQSFEINVFRNLADDFPEHKVWIDNVLNRIQDLATPFKNFHYYNPKQEGRWSIKKVLPALTKLSYDDMDIGNGGDASALYYFSHIKKEIQGKKKIREDLLKYCELDTWAMVEILKRLLQISL
jgi:hypothetical protein